MIVRITWPKALHGFDVLQSIDYEDMDDVSLRIHTLIMNRIPFKVEYL